jgi:hypothetical protein
MLRPEMVTDTSQTAASVPGKCIPNLIRKRSLRVSFHIAGKRGYVAVAHSMLVAIYHILKDGVVFKNLGADFYNQFNKKRKINAYL